MDSYHKRPLQKLRKSQKPQKSDQPCHQSKQQEEQELGHESPEEPDIYRFLSDMRELSPSERAALIRSYANR